MARQDVLRDLKATLGIIPGFVEQMPDKMLDEWWDTSKNFFMADTALPVKTKALLGVCAAAAVHCRY